MVRSVRSGEIDDFDAVDKITELVPCSGIHPIDAEKLVRAGEWGKKRLVPKMEVTSGDTVQLVMKVPEQYVQQTRDAVLKEGFRDVIVKSLVD